MTENDMTEQIEPCPNPECGKIPSPVISSAGLDGKFKLRTACVCGVSGPWISIAGDETWGSVRQRSGAAWNALARAVREATEWRQRAEAAEAKWAEEVESQMDRFSVYRHRKTGRMYVLLAGAYMESDGAPVVCYKSLDTGKHYVRPDAEFFDPERFKRISLPARPADGGDDGR